MKINATATLLALLSFLMIENAIGSSVGSGTVVSRRPVVDKSTPSPTSIQNKPTPTTEIHSTIVDEGPSTEDQELPSPTTVKHENHEEPDHQDDPKTTTTSDPQTNVDPTDYSTVWPTRWRPRRRMNFGAEGGAGKPRAIPDRLLIISVIIGAFISGILL